ncbi:MAG TPA: LuxR C-terminal-related transcriptional regulator [Solirubrobacteraceae bacterium]|nr:LuxR C-terminal-related transcriptional regulator [Solirubrobacteraceae bacterium]
MESTFAARRDKASGIPGLLHRRALFDLLTEGAAGGVTLVCAPPGSGKTAVLRSWTEYAGMTDRVAWVSVERGERDAQRFWLSVVEALCGPAGGAGFGEKFSPTPDFRGEVVVERLVSDLGSLERPVVLVIDDLHELHSREALGQLEFLLGHLPAELRVVLATRRDPQLGLHRLRVAGELTELRAADLRFTSVETRDLLDAAGIALSEVGLALLQDRTEGWAAGVRLAALSLVGHPEPERFVSEFSGSERTVADYLLAEVLDRQTEEVRRLLLRTSVLERVSGPLADVLTGGSGSERILHMLTEANAFVASIDVGRSWFRYHHLFADLLRLELRRTAPDEVASLHRAAAGWFEVNGDVVEAIRHSQSARDWPTAARLLTENLVSLSLDGRLATVQAMFAQFPRDAGAAEAELAAILAFGSFAAAARRAAPGDRSPKGALDEAEGQIAAAERHAATLADDRRRPFDLMLGVARMSLAGRHGDLQGVLEAARRLAPHLEAPGAREAALSNDMRAVALLQLGIAELWSFRLPDSRRHLEEALALARRIGRPFLEVSCLGHLAMAANEHSFALVGEESAKAIAIAERHGLAGEPVAAIAMVAWAGALTWTGRFAEAERWLGRAEDLRPEIEPATVLMTHNAIGMLRAGQGRHEEALAAFCKAEEIQSLLASEHFSLAHMRSVSLRTRVRLGEVAAARAALVAMDDEERDRGELRVAAAAIELAEDNPQLALDVLEPLLEPVLEPVLGPVLGRSARVIHPAVTIEALLVSAAAHDALDDARSAEAAVEGALDLAEPDAVILPFTITPVRELIERHPRHRTAHATLVTDILDVLAARSVSSPPIPHAGPLPVPEELSDAELRVIRYLPSNLSAPEIAAQLYVSANTVKTHMRHIYAKLGAHNRTDAVERARHLGLLAPSSRLR